MTEFKSKTENIDLYLYDDYRRIYDDTAIREQADNMLDDNKSLQEILEFCRSAHNKKIAEKTVFNLKEKLNLTQRYKDCCFETFKTSTDNQKRALDKAKDYTNCIISKRNDTKNLIIQGKNSVGTGKTHLACAIVNELCNNGIPARFINSVDMFNKVRKNWDSEEFKKVDVLFIDDLGKEKASDWAYQTLYEIINYRYEQLKPTIITIETTIPCLSEHYGESGKAIIDRLTHDFDLITLDGNSYRHER